MEDCTPKKVLDILVRLSKRVRAKKSLPERIPKMDGMFVSVVFRPGDGFYFKFEREGKYANLTVGNVSCIEAAEFLKKEEETQ